MNNNHFLAISKNLCTYWSEETDFNTQFKTPEMIMYSQAMIYVII